MKTNLFRYLVWSIASTGMLLAVSSAVLGPQQASAAGLNRQDLPLALGNSSGELLAKPTKQNGTPAEPTATTTESAPTVGPVAADPTATPTPTEPPPTAPPTATEPPPTVTPTTLPGYYRPLVLLQSYKARPGTLNPGSNFGLEFSLANQGQLRANNIMIMFSSADVLPRGAGGVVVIGALEPGESRQLEHPFQVSTAALPGALSTLEVRVSYTDDLGTAFSESFTVGLTLGQPTPTPVPGGSGPKPTPTPTESARALLVIRNAETDVEPLQPGARFNLLLEVVNLGSSPAHRVSMIAGGAALAPADPDKPEGPKGVTASGGEFTNFSPIGSSNVQFLGDIPAGASMTAQQPLIVNVSTAPGAYSFKISFAYFDEDDEIVIEDQVVTLLVLLNPILDISMYRDPGPLYMGQPNSIPLQIINLGRKTAVLGNLIVTAERAQLENNTLLIGSLDAGGFLTLDALLIPESEGPLDVLVTVHYNDDFNQPQMIQKTLTLDVFPAPVDFPGNGPDGGDPGDYIPEDEPETFVQIVMRFLRGMIGLGSGRANVNAEPGPLPGGESPPGDPIWLPEGPAG